MAFEGEYYFGRWTIQGIAGVEFGNFGSSTTTVVGLVFTTSFTGGYDIKTRFFDQINLKYYFTDNWNGYVGHRYQGGKHALALGTEEVIPLTRSLTTTAFLEGSIGESDHHGIWGGLRYYFGKPEKTLIRWHREDDLYELEYAVHDPEFFRVASSTEMHRSERNDGRWSMPPAKRLGRDITLTTVADGIVRCCLRSIFSSSREERSGACGRRSRATRS